MKEKDCNPKENLEDKMADNSGDGGMMEDSDGEKKGAYILSAEELSLSPTPNNYETPALNDEEDNSEKENSDHSDQGGEDDEVRQDAAAAENAEERQNLESGGSTRPNAYAGCEVCNYRGFIAFHLRSSKGCVKQLRSKPTFIQIKGSDEVFTVKFALLAGECPSSTCPTGRHTVLPEECLEWWITEGWVTLGWKGQG